MLVQRTRQARVASDHSSDLFSDSGESDDVTQDYIANLAYDSDTNSADVRHVRKPCRTVFV